MYRIKRDAPPAPPRIPQKFHNFLDFYTAPPKFTHAPPKFTHFRSMSSGDILILVDQLKVTISPELPKLMAPPAPPKQFFTEILWNFLYRIKRNAPPAPPRIPQKFHNFLDFYTAPPKFTHAPPKFTHFRSMSSGDILILVDRVTISPELPKFKNGSADEINSDLICLNI